MRLLRGASEVRCVEVLWTRLASSPLPHPPLLLSSHTNAEPLSYFCPLACYFYLQECMRPLKGNTSSSCLPFFLPSSLLSALPPRCHRHRRRLHKVLTCVRTAGRQTTMCSHSSEPPPLLPPLPLPCLRGDQELLRSANTDGGFCFFFCNYTLLDLIFFFQGITHVVGTLHVHGLQDKYLCIMS